MKRLSYLLTLLILFPTFTHAGGKKHHEQQHALQEIKEFLGESYSDKNDFDEYFEEDKKEVQKHLNVLPSTLGNAYHQKIQKRAQQLYNKHYRLNPKQERTARAERNRINRARNDAQRTNPYKIRTTRNNQNKKKTKPQTLKQQMVSWIKNQVTQHPLRTIAVLGALCGGSYKLWQMFNAHRNNNPHNQNNAQRVQCLLCEQQKPANEIIRLACDHTFCGNCLHRYIAQNDVLLNDRRVIPIPKRYCPVENCKRHLCGNLCTRTRECQQERCNSHNQIICNRHRCANRVEPLRARINTARQRQQQRLRREQLNNNPNHQNNQPQMTWWQSILQIPLQIVTMILMQSLGS